MFNTVRKYWLLETNHSYNRFNMNTSLPFTCSECKIDTCQGFKYIHQLHFIGQKSPLPSVEYLICEDSICLSNVVKKCKNVIQQCNIAGKYIQRETIVPIATD